MPKEPDEPQGPEEPEEREERNEEPGTVFPFPARYNEHGVRWEPWCDEGAAARHFGVSGATVRRWRKLGMPSRRFGGARRYRLSECDAWHAAQENAS
jgi:hypothetical protein